jgi:DNA-binding CsgD family transcriptional regulator
VKAARKRAEREPLSKGVVVSRACASYAIHRWVVLSYEVLEEPIGSDSGWSGPGLFERLLERGVDPETAADAEIEELPITPGELFGSSGWRRIDYRLKAGVHRVVVEQSATARPLRLTPRELQACELAALGQKSRYIGEGLGIAAATARGAIDRSVAKLRLASAIQLPLLWYTIGAPARRVSPISGVRHLVFERELAALSRHRLTTIERMLVERVLLGDSYRGMAAYRGVSTRTVANQLSRLYEKFGVSGRAELVAALLAAPPDPSSEAG